jgi:hypothetical protein
LHLPDKHQPKLSSELGDFAAAAMYFGRMASTFGESGWNTVETTMLKVYAHCLKKLNRKDEFVRTLLDVLAKSAASKRSIRTHKTGENVTGASQIPNDWLNDDQVNTAGIFSEIVDYSQQLPYDVNVQMAKYFNDIVVEPYVRHFDGKDGFQLRIQFRHLLEDEVEFDKAKIRLIDANSAQSKDIWLESTEAGRITKGVCRVWLSSNVCVPTYITTHRTNFARSIPRARISSTRSSCKRSESHSYTSLSPKLRRPPLWVSSLPSLPLHSSLQRKIASYVSHALKLSKHGFSYPILYTSTSPGISRLHVRADGTRYSGPRYD